MSFPSSSASPSSSTAASASAAFTAPPPLAGFRPHASSEILRFNEAGPALDRRTERQRSTLSGSDRKRRIVNLEGDAWSSRAAPEPLTDAGPSSRAEMDSSRSISQLSFQTRQDSALPSSSYATPVGLTTSPLESRPLGTGSWSRADNNYVEYIRPHWQPDAEVTKCPICGSTFTFWYRKHHCRKCGRVVCASCSPHRITIPRQFIVRDPSRSHASSSLIPPRTAPALDIEGDDTVHSPTALNPALGGGEEVRLCNPCVPDPNPEPLRGFATVRTRGEADSGTGIVPGPYVVPSSQSRRRSYHSVSSTTNPYSGVLPGTFPSRSGRRTVGSSEYSTFGGFGSTFASRFHERPMDYGSLSGPRVPPAPMGAGASARPLYPAAGSASSLPVSSSRVRPPALQTSQWRRNHVEERDLCPICDQALPALGENGSEDAREAHIRDCIESHGRQGRLSPPSGSPVAQAHLPVRLVVFKATEKDCVGQDGGLQECTICMEEYEVGQSLVRLECLCKFHKRCIVEWFERKKECPVHKVS
ncbi:phosphatidylinositol-3-phosphate-binding ubiquitin-protein ligase [Aspergillus ibericus CBS 121593]|uniref:RING-type E3 ubiquitin transferase n=1 Tax=Aspergillus ibericus CBS 121593 TaxID=1448316 RepID=A0A395HDJ5_9EURO|nr:A kinase anchor protein [Aspergillus ibericus CBS 121593]RAL04294.1 A kinase anchor protein [Aspergillus ibericus CBS 121593]